MARQGDLFHFFYDRRLALGAASSITRELSGTGSLWWASQHIADFDTGQGSRWELPRVAKLHGNGDDLSLGAYR
jgi:hypothetical protein